MLSLIAVIGKNRELGKDNKLLWHIPGDLPRFKKLTTDHPVIMGKNTFLSIGRPLPQRTNIVVSTNLLPQEGIQIFSNIDDALKEATTAPGSSEIFIIGGGSLYSQTIDKAERLYLTVVDATAEADTFFPEYSQFKTIVSSETHQEGGYSFSYITLER